MKSGVAVGKVMRNSCLKVNSPFQFRIRVHFKIWFQGTIGTERFEYQ